LFIPAGGSGFEPEMLNPVTKLYINRHSNPLKSVLTFRVQSS
jgi:hypothetical protein